MPKSKKRVKKEQPEIQVAMKNPLHSKLGKGIVIVLAAGFVTGVLATLIVVLVGIAQR